MLQVVADNSSPTPRVSTPAPPFLSTADLRRRYGVSSETLRRWRRTSKGPSFLMIGERVKYPLASVLSYEAERAS